MSNYYGRQPANAPASSRINCSTVIERFPSYEQFTMGDFAKLPEGDLRAILGAFMSKNQPELLIPSAFTEKYQDGAAAATVLAVVREAARRHKPELYAIASLNGALGSLASRVVVRSDVPASVNIENAGERKASAPQILNYVVALEAMAVQQKNEEARQQKTYTPQTEMEVTVPSSAIHPVVLANPKLPRNLLYSGISFTAHDEIAYMSGYATRAGASAKIDPIVMEYPVSAICDVPTINARVFDPKYPDVDVGLAWAAGYIQRDAEIMPPERLQLIRERCNKTVSR